MSDRRQWAAVWLLSLMAIPALARGQAADDSREKSEKVSEILAAAQLVAAGARVEADWLADEQVSSDLHLLAALTHDTPS
jgi:hypothetical protein